MSETAVFERNYVTRAGALAVTAGARLRIDSVDLLRGLVMVLMALDHVRDFFGAGGTNPRDVADAGLFLTRWITHFCAPTFVLLAGISAYLYGSRRRSTGELSGFLITRGLWLMVIELTIVRFGWRFNLALDVVVLQVIWVIGASMVVLAGLVHLPRWGIAVTAVLLMSGHNLLDGIPAESLESWAWLWNVLHQPGIIAVRGLAVFPLYTLVPWVGVMAAGYVLGPIMWIEAIERRRWLLRLGIAILIGFVLLRATNLYGDPAAWSFRGDWLPTMLSFINCEKYPPSLLYLMMTLGPALILLALAESAGGRVADWITVYGRVPLFYYVTHLYLIHLAAIGYALMSVGDADFLLHGFPLRKDASYGLSLPALYAVWLLVVIALFPLCRWYAALKQSRCEWWWSYL